MPEFTPEEIAKMSLRDRAMLGIYTDPGNKNSLELVEERVNDSRLVEETEAKRITASTQLGFGESPSVSRVSHYRNSEKSKSKE